ncbi:MAG: hypothetical protein KBC74_03505 [Candidatus Pacebacteria bacterium]|nr:hypothetical protein [Candidatus Paceibacterota bacterium]
MAGYEGGPRDPMNFGEAEEYVRRNAEVLPIPTLLGPDHIHCIDSRRTKKGIGYPGGMLGLTTTLFSGVHEDAHEHVGGFKGFAQFLEGLFGGMSAHTDDDHEHDPSGCRGCGHMQSLMTNHSAYGFGSKHAEEVRSYSTGLKTRWKEGAPGFNIFQYGGKANPRAIMHVEDPRDGHYISLPPNDGTDQVFVHNRGANHGILGDAVNFILGGFGDIFKSHPRDVYDEHIALTIDALASDLPHFTVGHDGKKITVG